MTYISYNQSLPHGSQYLSAITQLVNGMNGLHNVLTTMAAMLTGDGSDASHFAVIAEQFGIPAVGSNTANQQAKALFEEMSSADGNFTKAAINQLADKTR